MKTVLSVVCIAIIACVFSGCKKDITKFCETGTCTIEKPKDTYNYPIKPGMPIWATYTTSQQQLEALQIPADTLAIITTDGLIQTCVDFPALGDLLLNIGVNVAGSINRKMETFSGMIELCKRPDAGIKMKERYKKMYPDCINKLATYDEKAKFVAAFSAYEMMISYDSIIGKLTIAEKKDLVRMAINKYNCKRNQRNNFAYYDFATSLYIPTKIMMQENYIPFSGQVPNDGILRSYVTKLLFPMTYNEAEKLFDFIYTNSLVFME